MKNNFFLNKYKKSDSSEKLLNEKSPKDSKVKGKPEKVYFKKLEVKPEIKKEEPKTDKKRVTCLFLIMLGIEKASILLKKFNEEEALKIAKELLLIKNISAKDLKDVESQFGKKNLITLDKVRVGKDYLRELLQKAFGMDIGSRIFIAAVGEDSINNSLSFMNQLSPKTIIDILSKESDTIFALILTMMAPKTTAEILKLLPKEKAPILIKKMSQKIELNPDVQDAIIEKLKNKTKNFVNNEVSPLKGKEKLVEILKNSNFESSLSILEELEKDSPELVDEIKSKIFSFDDIAKISKKNLSMVLRGFKDNDIAFILKGAKEETKNAFLNAMSKNRRELINQDIVYLGTVKKSEVIEKQKEFLNYLIDLDQKGKINLKAFEEIYVE